MVIDKSVADEVVDECIAPLAKSALSPTLGSEGKFVIPQSQHGRTIAVFTSGGDSQGKRYPSVPVVGVVAAWCPTWCLSTHLLLVSTICNG
jgi:hypothetical protein